MTPEDTKYVSQVVAQRAGISQAEAEKRVNDTFARAKASTDEAVAKAKQAADAARKTVAYGSLWLFIALIIGALVAAWFGILDQVSIWQSRPAFHWLESFVPMSRA